MANMDELKVRQIANEEANKVLAAYDTAQVGVPRRKFKLWLISINVAYAIMVLIVAAVWIFTDGMTALFTFLGIILVILPMIVTAIVLNRIIKD